MVIAAGSYPAGRWFESDRRYHLKTGESSSQKINLIRPLGQAVKTSPFHGGNMGSIPVGVTTWEHSSAGRASALQAEGHRFEPCCSHQQKHIARAVFFCCQTARTYGRFAATRIARCAPRVTADNKQSRKSACIFSACVGDSKPKFARKGKNCGAIADRQLWRR